MARRHRPLRWLSGVSDIIGMAAMGFTLWYLAKHVTWHVFTLAGAAVAVANRSYQGGVSAVRRAGKNRY